MRNPSVKRLLAWDGGHVWLEEKMAKVRREKINWEKGGSAAKVV